MGSIRAGFERLLAAAVDGRLVDPCRGYGVRVLGVFGSITRGEAQYEQLRDLDVAVAFEDGRKRDLLGLIQELSALSECDRIDLLDLHRADPVSREEGLRGVPLYESEPGAYAQALIIAAQARLDSVWLRRLQEEHTGGAIPRSFDPALVRTRLGVIEELLEDLGHLLPAGAERIVQDRLSQRALERILLHLIQMTVNINAYAATALTGTAPRSHHASFAAVARTGLIDSSLADQLAPSAGLRTLLVHEPGGMDTSRLFMMGMRMQECYGNYVRQAKAFLEARENAASRVTVVPATG